MTKPSTLSAFAETNETPGGRYAKQFPPTPASPKAYPKGPEWCGDVQDAQAFQCSRGTLMVGC